jgi:hypothetical protein
MKIKILETAIVNKSNGINLNVVDVEIIEGDIFLPNNKYFSEDKKTKFLLLSIGHYSPSILNKYPCIIEIEDNIDLKSLKGKIFIME